MYTEGEEKARDRESTLAEMGDIFVACTYSHSFKTWSSGGVQAHTVRTAMNTSLSDRLRITEIAPLTRKCINFRRQVLAAQMLVEFDIDGLKTLV